MNTSSIYTDTSVIGGCFDPEFRVWSAMLFTEFESGKKLMMISDLTMKELESAPKAVCDVVTRVPLNCRLDVAVNDTVIDLADLYIKEGALSLKSYNDALHIAPQQYMALMLLLVGTLSTL